MIFKSDVTQGAWLQGPGFAVIDMGQVAGYFMVPVALAVYAVVWVVSHTINILILISPFATVDAALKAFRATVLASVVGSHWFSDTLGLLWAGVLVFICLMLAGWAFRLMVFGHEFAWDLLTFRRKRFSPSSGVHWCFLARRIGRVPVRTYGKLERAGGDALKFTYRPFLVLPPRTVEIPGRSLGIGRGMLHPEVLRVEGEEVSDIFDLPPRYSGHEQVVAGALGITEIRDVGLRAAWSWLKGLLGGRSAA
jgi:hypothetical protein